MSQVRTTTRVYLRALSYTLGQRIVAGAIRGVTMVAFSFFMRHLRNSCRWHFSGPLDEAIRSGRPFVLAGWHQDVLALFHYLAIYSHLERSAHFVMMSSRSFDGEVTEQIMRPFGYTFVRGSAGKAGARAALRGLRRAARAGGRVVLIADGPGPPPYLLRPGPVFLARDADIPLYVVRAWVRPQRIVPRTWFRLAIPMLRSDVAIFSAGPVDVSGRFESARLRAEKELHRLGKDVDEYLYLRRRPRRGVRFTDRPV